MPLPEAFLLRLQEILQPQDLADTLSSMAQPKLIGFRINRLRWFDSRASLIAQLRADGLNVAVVEGVTDVLAAAAAHKVRLSHSNLAAKAQIYITNPSSVLAVEMLAPQPGEQILDLSAAPGGKTIQVAEWMENRGRVAAVDVVKSRFHRMRANLARNGATLVDCYLKDGRDVGAKCPEMFDRVLLDAPCSSEGRFRVGEPSSFRHWSERKIRDTSRKQKGLLKSAFRSLKPGGELLYCTCSFAPEENELVVNSLLRKFSNAEILPLPLHLPRLRPGLTQWRGKSLIRSLSLARRIIPDSLWDGFFLCRLTKTSPIE